MKRYWRSLYSPHLIYSSEQLRRVSQTISEAFGPRRTDASPKLVLMPVDPFHLHAYWSSSAIGEPASESGCGDQLRLRIYCQIATQPESASHEAWFDIPVAREKSWCDIRLPLDNLRCRGVLGRTGGVMPFVPLLRSSPVQVPKAGVPDLPAVAARYADGADTAMAGSVKRRRYDERLIDAIIRLSLSGSDIEAKVAARTRLQPGSDAFDALWQWLPSSWNIGRPCPASR